MNELFKRIFSVVVILTAAQIYDGRVSAEIQLTQNNTEGISIKYRPEISFSDTVVQDGRTYLSVGFEGHSVHNSPGEPSIPVKSLLFALPEGMIPNLVVENLAFSVKDGIILPVPFMVDRGTGFTYEMYTEDPLSYAMSGFIPHDHAIISGPELSSGFNLWELSLSPVLFDAHSGKSAFADSMDIIISFSGAGSWMIFSNIPDYIINADLFRHAPSALRLSATSINPFATGEWYKITVTQTGMHVLTGADLMSAGLPENISSSRIRMYYGGGELLDLVPTEITTSRFREIAIQVDDGGDGVFGRNDSIIFYGEALSRFINRLGAVRPVFQNHFYTDNNVYWLTVDNSVNGKRISKRGEPVSLPAATSYRRYVHIEQENYLELEHGGVEWYWDAISSTPRTYTFQAPGKVQGRPDTVIVGFIHHSKSLTPTTHNGNITLNNTISRPFNWGFVTTKTEVILSGALLPDNNLRIVRTGPGDRAVHLDYIQLIYDSELSFSGSSFDFFWDWRNPSAFHISNINSSNYRIYDVSDPVNVAMVETATYNSPDRTLTFQTPLPSNRLARFVISEPSKYFRPVSVSKKNYSNIRNPNLGANYFVITHPMFRSEAQRLANWRAADSQIDPLIPLVVDVYDIMDEFGWGVYDPTAIRDFLKFAWENGDRQKKYYCVFMGNAGSIYKRYTQPRSGTNFVPTYSGHENGLMVTDDFFGIFDSSRRPSFAFGRIAVEDRPTAETVVSEIIDYERNPVPGLWHNRIMFIADDEFGDPGSNSEDWHTKNVENIDAPFIVPPSMERTKLMMIDFPMRNKRKPDVTDQMITTINDEGVVLKVFFGHGNNDLLAHEHILVANRDIGRFQNGGKKPLFLIMSCSTSNFAREGTTSLAEVLHLKRDGGFIGIIGATELSGSWANEQLTKEIFLNLFNRNDNPEHRIGEALRVAKVKRNGERNARMYALLGDPATRLMIPRYDFAVDIADTLYKLQVIPLSGNVVHDSQNIPYTGTLHVRARGPEVQRSYQMASSSRTITYRQPGKLFFNSEIDISGEGFETSLIIPKDLNTDGNPTIHLFASGQSMEGAGALQGFAVGGLYSGAPDDRTGPEIDVKFDDKPYREGDFISRRPLMKATFADSSGINILGNRGQNISLILNRTTQINLTERYRAVNGFTSGIVEYQLPILSPGEHVLELSATDSHNNTSRKTLNVQVIGSETGDISIQDLLNYPNPMGNEGTTFTFTLTDDSPSAEIRIFTQSGRLVDTIRSTATYGYNQIEWIPRRELANGVYFYKLTVTSPQGRKASKIEKLVVMK